MKLAWESFVQLAKEPMLVVQIESPETPVYVRSDGYVCQEIWYMGLLDLRMLQHR